MELFLDLETTGTMDDARVCSIACLLQEDGLGHIYYDLVNEGKKIPPDASSIHNITNEMIANKPRLIDSKSYKVLIDALDRGALLIAHNLPFELKMLANTPIEPQRAIDTLRVCRHLIPDLNSYSLNYLRYEMRLYKKEATLAREFGLDICLPLVPHHARSDAMLTKLLYDALLELASSEEMCRLSQKPVLLERFLFAKYAKRYIEEIATVDRGYLVWMLENIEDLDLDMRYTLEYYLKEGA